MPHREGSRRLQAAPACAPVPPLLSRRAEIPSRTARVTASRVKNQGGTVLIRTLGAFCAPRVFLISRRAVIFARHTGNTKTEDIKNGRENGKQVQL